MPAKIQVHEIHLHDPVRVRFGVTGLAVKHAKSIVRDVVRDAWPVQRRWAQSVYVIRLLGEVAVSYPKRFSPVIYIGEGNAFHRFYNHVATWIVPLLLAVPQLAIEVRIAEVTRRNHPTLYKHIEADLIRWFSGEHGALPWFNKQWETSMEGCYEYEREALSELSKLVTIGSGTTYLWSIQPTHNNEQYESFRKGICSTRG